MGKNMSNGVRQMGRNDDREDWLEGQRNGVTGRWNSSRGRWIYDNAMGDVEPVVPGEGQMVVGLMDGEMTAKGKDRWVQLCTRLGEEVVSMLRQPGFPVGL